MKRKVEGLTTVIKAVVEKSFATEDTKALLAKVPGLTQGAFYETGFQHAVVVMTEAFAVYLAGQQQSFSRYKFITACGLRVLSDGTVAYPEDSIPTIKREPK